MICQIQKLGLKLMLLKAVIDSKLTVKKEILHRPLGR